MAKRKAIVVGAGVGGVTTAALLAKAGFEVSVFEKNSYCGGRCSLRYYKDHRFDVGPSLLLLPRIFHSVFQDLGTSLQEQGVNLLQCHPNYEIWFDDGEKFRVSTDTAQMKSEIEKFEGTDGFHRYLGFLREAHQHYELSVTHVLSKNFTTLFSMLRPSFVQHLLALHPFESIWSRASKYFWTERLRRVFTFASMYMGMSPFDAPGTYSLLQYTELAEGIWYPEGGFYRIIDAIVEIGKGYGVTYHLKESVSSIILEDGGKRAKGIQLESGQTHSADVVIVNADLVYAYNNLLPKSAEAHALQKRKASCSSISFYWAMDHQFLELATHNIFLASKYRESFDDIFKRQQLPDEPSFYLNVPSRVDSSAAPPGKDSIVVLLPVGHLLDEVEGRGIETESKQDWDQIVEKARSTVFDIVAQRTGADLRSALVKEFVHTPVSWKDTFNLDKGAILGLSHDFFNVLSFRPKTKHSSIDRLHFVGASTHPGTGVPICIAGGRIVADQILDSFSMSKPWFQGPPQTANSEIDRVQYPSLFSYFHIALIAMVSLILGLIFTTLPPIGLPSKLNAKPWNEEIGRRVMVKCIDLVRLNENRKVKEDPRKLSPIATSMARVQHTTPDVDTLLDSLNFVNIQGKSTK